MLHTKHCNQNKNLINFCVEQFLRTMSRRSYDCTYHDWVKITTIHPDDADFVYELRITNINSAHFGTNMDSFRRKIKRAVRVIYFQLCVVVECLLLVRVSYFLMPCYFVFQIIFSD